MKANEEWFRINVGGRRYILSKDKTHMEYPSTKELLLEIKAIMIHHFIQPRSIIHSKNRRVVQNIVPS